MKSHTVLKIVLTLTSLHLSTTSTIASELSRAAEEDFNKTYEYYVAHHENLTPRVLGKIEFELKKIVNDPNTPYAIPGDSACLLFLLDSKTLHIEATNILFNRADFNPKLYSTYIKEIRRIKSEKTLKNGK